MKFGTSSAVRALKVPEESEISRAVDQHMAQTSRLREAVRDARRETTPTPVEVPISGVLMRAIRQVLTQHHDGCAACTELAGLLD